MEQVIFSNRGGCGLIADFNENEKDFLIDKEFTINGCRLKVNDLTDLFGLFDKPVRYAGALKCDFDCMCFHLGTNGDLFQVKSYYSCFFFISENRLVNKYSHNSARDYNYIDGRWK